MPYDPEKHDPALHPEWVRDESGVMVPYRSPLMIEAERIAKEAAAREQASYEAGFPAGGHDLQEEHQERTRGGGRRRR